MLVHIRTSLITFTQLQYQGVMLFPIQMWTPLQVFSGGFVHTDKFQLPLYHGIPNKVTSSTMNNSVTPSLFFSMWYTA